MLTFVVQGALAQFFAQSSSNGLHSIPTNLQTSDSNLKQISANGLMSNGNSAGHGLMKNISRYPSFLQGPFSCKDETSSAVIGFDRGVEGNARVVTSDSSEQCLQRQQNNQVLIPQMLVEAVEPRNDSNERAKWSFASDAQPDSLVKSYNNGQPVERLPEVSVIIYSL